TPGAVDVGALEREVGKGTERLGVVWLKRESTIEGRDGGVAVAGRHQGAPQYVVHGGVALVPLHCLFECAHGVGGTSGKTQALAEENRCFQTHVAELLKRLNLADGA